MIEIVYVTGTIFVLILIGYLSVRMSIFSQNDMSVLGRYVVSFALPALIFRAVSGRDVSEILNSGYLGAYLLGSLLVFAAGYAWGRRGSDLTATASTFQGMGMSCANSGFVGYPILLMAMPPVASTALALNMIVENLVMIPLVLVMAERARGRAGGDRAWALATQIAGRLARNPIVIALIAGLCVSLARIEVPGIVARPVDLVASSSAAVSLVAIGGTLAGLPLRKVDVRIVQVVVGKLLLHPLAVWLGLLGAAAAGFAVADPRLAEAAILLAGMPAMSIYPILAQRYGEQESAALAMLVMTVLSFFTISALLGIVGFLPTG